MSRCFCSTSSTGNPDECRTLGTKKQQDELSQCVGFLEVTPKTPKITPEMFLKKNGKLHPRKLTLSPENQWLVQMYFLLNWSLFRGRTR